MNSTQSSGTRQWTLRVCSICGTAINDVPCAGFPGMWNEDRSDFERGSCIAELVAVVEVPE